nr:MAG TPA: hypothetical protein [Caudoviricetes sp.]
MINYLVKRLRDHLILMYVVLEILQKVKFRKKQNR